MRKNQKYSKAEMFLTIERWQKSGLSQVKFCAREKISLKTFHYWLRKYRNEKSLESKQNTKDSETFIPVEVSGSIANKSMPLGSGRIELLFPNGVRMSSPAGIDVVWLKSLINF
jgi:hypothetical protein